MSHDTIMRVLQHLDEYVIDSMNEHTLTGLGVGIVHGKEVIYTRGFGLAQRVPEQYVSPDTVFRIASISKTLTAIGVMQLWEQGKFQLDDPVNNYLKHYRIEHTMSSAPPVTFLHLLTHTSGLGELRSLGDLFLPLFGLAARPGEPVPEPKEYYANGLTPDVYPQMKHAYSNHAFTTLGQLIEDISGEPFESYMLTHVLEPLGMHQSDYRLSERVSNHLAEGYALKRGKVTPVPYLDVVVKGAGAVLSSVNDMTRYMVALLNGGEQNHTAVLKPETLRMMMEPHYQIDNRLPAMGLSFWLGHIANHRIVHHSGGWPGFVSCMLLAPDDNLGVVLLSNTGSLIIDRLTKDIVRLLLAVPDDAERVPHRGILELPHMWSDVCGFYAPDEGLNTNARIWALLGGEVEVFVKDNHLSLRSLTGPLWRGARLYPVDAKDPLVFRLSPDAHVLWPPGFTDYPLDIVFKRNVTGQVDRLCAGFNALYKRPWNQSLRFKSLVVPGGLAGLAATMWGVWKLSRKRESHVQG